VVSLGDVAKAAGVSKSSACYVLRNQAGPSKATREKVMKAAKKLGYVPDANMLSFMSKVRDAKEKDLLPIAWLDTNWERDSWHKYKFFLPYLEGAKARALQLGYRIEEIWAGEPGLTMKRVSDILYQRGIEGVVVTHPAKHFRLKWDYLAAVSLEGHLLAPRLHRVLADRPFNILLALKMVKRMGYRRIGICVDETFSHFSNHGGMAVINQFLATMPKMDRVAPLFIAWHRVENARLVVEDRVVAWMRDQRPEVIVGNNGCLLDWARHAGYRVPEDLGIVHTAIDDDVADWAGIYSNRRKIGAVAAEQVISLTRNREFGIPSIPISLVIRGNWRHGNTLLNLKAKAG